MGAKVWDNRGAAAETFAASSAAPDEVISRMTCPSQDYLQTHSVYKYYDSHGILIYVGITKAGMGRNRQHNSDKVWWPFVAKQEVEHCESREHAHEREIALIQQFRPPFNKQHNPDHADVRSAYIEMRQSGRIDQEPGTLLAAGAHKAMRLHLIEVDDLHYKFLTSVADAPLAACLGGPIGARVFWGDNGPQLGKVTKISGGMVARVHARLALPENLRIESAVMRLSAIKLKKPVVLGVKTIRVCLTPERGV